MSPSFLSRIPPESLEALCFFQACFVGGFVPFRRTVAVFGGATGVDAEAFDLPVAADFDFAAGADFDSVFFAVEAFFAFAAEAGC